MRVTHCYDKIWPKLYKNSLTFINKYNLNVCIFHDAMGHFLRIIRYEIKN